MWGIELGKARAKRQYLKGRNTSMLEDLIVNSIRRQIGRANVLDRKSGI
jgi:hypothetical protein